jgi:hypothetical protein
MIQKQVKSKQKMNEMKTCDVFTKILKLLIHGFRNNFKNIQIVPRLDVYYNKSLKGYVFGYVAKITNTETEGKYQVRLTGSYIEFNYFGTVSPLISCHLHLFHHFIFILSMFAERR